MSNNEIKGSDSQLLNSFKTLLISLLRLWWVFLLIGVLSGMLGIFYSMGQKVNYESRLTFALDEGGSSGVGNILNLASQFGINVGDGKDMFAGDNILEIMKSRRIIDDVLTSVDTFEHKPYTLIEYYILSTKDEKEKSKKKSVHFPADLSPDNYTRQQDSVLLNYYHLFRNDLIKANRPDRKLSIYEIKVTTPDEKLTKVFTDKLLKATDKFYKEIRTKKSKQTLDVLEKRMEIMKGSLNSSISKSAQTQDVNMNPAFKKADIPVQQQQVNIRAYSGAYGELFKNLEIARFQYLNEMPLIQVIDGAKYPMKRAHLGKLTAAVIFAFLAEILFLMILGIKRVFWD